MNASTVLVSCYADDCEYEHSSDIMLHWWLWIRAQLWYHAMLMIVNTSTALTSCYTDDCEYEHISDIMLRWWLWIRAQLWHHVSLMIVNTSTALVSCYTDDCEYEHRSDIMLLRWWHNQHWTVWYIFYVCCNSIWAELIYNLQLQMHHCNLGWC